MGLLVTLVIVLAAIYHVNAWAISTTASIRQLSSGGVNPLSDTINDEHAKHLTPHIETVLLERGLRNGFPSSLQVAGDWDPNDPASPDQLDKYAKKGAFLRCLLDGTDAAAGMAWDPLGRTPGSASSQWKGTLENELQTWYWTPASVNQAEQCYYGSPSDIGVALEGLGLNIHPTTNGGHNICYTVEHFIDGQEDDNGDEVPPEDQHYTVAGKQYKATGAFYTFGINRVGGAIIAKNLESPTFAAEYHWEYKPSPDELPAIRHGSDIMLAYWLRDNANPRNLRYYFATGIVNEDTLPLICSVIKSKGHQGDPPSWPGVQLHKGESEFDMLLGSPIGATLAFMLIQHKAEIGIKHVTDIVIFGTKLGAEGFVQVHMVFKIADVDNPFDLGLVTRSEDKQHAARNMSYLGGYGNAARTHILF